MFIENKYVNRKLEKGGGGWGNSVLRAHVVWLYQHEHDIYKKKKWNNKYRNFIDNTKNVNTLYENRNLKKVGTTKNSVPRAPVEKYGNLDRDERITFRRLRLIFSILKSTKEYAKRARNVILSNTDFHDYYL